MQWRLSLVALTIAVGGGCVSPYASNVGLSDNLTKDMVLSRIDLGMTKAQLDEKLSRDVFLWEHKRPGVDTNLPAPYNFAGYLTVPYDLLARIQPDTRWAPYTYWAGSDYTDSVDVYFDASEKVIGWAYRPTSKDKTIYGSERITSRLSDGMSRRRVEKALGPPTRIIDLPEERGPEYYVDHWWQPMHFYRTGVWIYEYPIEGGQTRTVCLIWEKEDSLGGWGYSHAHLVAEDYARAHAPKK